MFHERKQNPQESVDEFVEDLKRLFSKAYAEKSYVTPEAESMGETILANQFVAGLQPCLKARLMGTEGTFKTFDQLLLKARFEEVKSKELRSLNNATTTLPKLHVLQEPASKNSSASSGAKGDSRSWKCFNCGMEGHMKHECPYPKQSEADSEAHGCSTVATVTCGVPPVTQSQKHVEDLRQQLRSVEPLDVVEQAAATLHGVEASNESPKVPKN